LGRIFRFVIRLGEDFGGVGWSIGPFSRSGFGNGKWKMENGNLKFENWRDMGVLEVKNGFWDRIDGRFGVLNYHN
jgi:hypothetical protein